MSDEGKGELLTVSYPDMEAMEFPDSEGHAMTSRGSVPTFFVRTC